MLSTTYFGPVQWYQKLHRAEYVQMEQWESFQKQTYRNRCLIATTQGVQALTVPTERGGSPLIKDTRISDHGTWRHLQWNALQSLQRGYSPSSVLLPPSSKIDFREAICPKHPLPDSDFEPKPYYQVYQQKHGFLPNLSILELLFNMGNESILYL